MLAVMSVQLYASSTTRQRSFVTNTIQEISAVGVENHESRWPAHTGVSLEAPTLEQYPVRSAGSPGA